MIDATRRPADAKSASPEETRERILTACREVIAKKGKRGATTREIADVAGVNEATLFRHFGTKEALIVAVRAAFLRIRRTCATSLRSCTARFREDLRRSDRAMLERMESQMDMIRWSLVEQDYEAYDLRDDRLAPAARDLGSRSGVHAAAHRAGELHGDAKKLAMIFMGLIFMHALGAQEVSRLQPLSRRADEAAVHFTSTSFSTE